MIMNEQMERYRESLVRTSELILLSQCPQIKLDLRGMMKYAKSNRKKVMELTEDEKKLFIL